MENKNVRLGLLGLFALVGLGIAVLMAMMPAGATQTGDVYPGSGDWTIDSPTKVIDENVTVDGDIQINSVLELWNATIKMDLLVDGQYGIEVTANGNLMANDSLVTSTSGAREYYFRVYGRMTLKRVTVEETLDGVRILTSNTILIEDTKFLRSYGTGLYLENADGTTIRRILIQTNDLSVTASISARAGYYPDYYIRENVVAPGGALYIKGGKPTIDEVEVSVNGSMRVTCTYNKDYYYAYSYLNCYFPLVNVDSNKITTIKGITARDSNVNVEVTYHLYDNYGYGYYYLYTNGYVTVVNLLNYGTVQLEECKAVNVKAKDVKTTVYEYSYLYDVREYPSTSMTLFGATVDKMFSTAGPHRFKLMLQGATFEDVGVLTTTFTPNYNGSVDPTFYTDIIIDDVTVEGGSYPFSFNIAPKFTPMKTIHNNIRISNSTFNNMTGPVFTQSYSAGPSVDANVRSFALHQLILFENNTLRWNEWGNYGFIYKTSEYRYEYNNIYEMEIMLRNNDIRDNEGTLWFYYGNYYTTRGFERFTIVGNNIVNNSGSYYFFYVYAHDQIIMRDNRFQDCVYSNQAYMQDPGGDSNGKKPCKFLIEGNTFTRCAAGGRESYLFYIYFGGEVTIRDNNISKIETIFIRIYEYTYYSGYAKVVFEGNEISDTNGTVFYFGGYSTYHQYLTTYIEENKAWNINAPLVDYYPYGAQNYNYEATTFFRNNTVIGATGEVYKNYGKLVVSGNEFRNCEGYVLSLDYLLNTAPVIEDNIIVDCNNVYYIGSKSAGVLKMSLYVADLTVDCTGNAFYFKNLDCILENITVTPKAEVAIIAEDSNVDAMSSSIPIGSGRIVGTGEINVWFDLELNVEWANLADPYNSSGVRVAEALIVLYGSTGAYYQSDYTDDNGHLSPITIPQWSLRGSFMSLWSPYTVSATKYGVTSRQELDLYKSYTGSDALFFLLVDPHIPVVRITSPFDGDLFNTENVTIRGFSTEIGSGIGQVLVAVGDGEWMEVEFDENGDYQYDITNVPEGEAIELRARVFDIALNSNETSVTIKVDRTPPMLVVQYPDDGITVNEADILILGEYEVGAVISINGLEREGPSDGTLSEPFTLSEGSNVIVVMATDPAGNSVSETRTVRLDRFAPTLTVLAPRDGLITHVTNITVEGDAEKGSMVTISVMRSGTNTVDERVALRPDGVFQHKVDLEEGKNTIIVKSKDSAENINSIARVVYLDTSPPLCQITSPADGTVTNVNTIRVIGTAEVEGVTLYLNGKQVHNMGTVDRVVNLNEGDNVIELKAVDRIGNVYRDRVTVTLDTVAPVIVMDRPLEDHLKTHTKDLVVAGHVEGGAVKLTVMGTEVSLGTGGAFETTVTLPETGENEVFLAATDQAGNAGTHSIMVDYSNVLPMLAIAWQPGTSEIESQSATLFILGTTSPGVGKVTITHEKGDTTETATAPVGEDGSFSVARTMLEGDNTFTVSVTDEYGNTNTTAPYTVTYKYKAPREDVQQSEAVSPAVVAMWLLVFALVFLAIAIFVTRAFRQQENK